MSDENAAPGNQEDEQNNQEDEQNNQEEEAHPQPPPPPELRTLGFDMFMMYEFRTKFCPPHLMETDPHHPSYCPYVHPGTSRRRDPRQYNYLPELCQAIPGFCGGGDRCEFCHNILEYCLHPRKFRKTRCLEGPNCKKFPCLFAHNPAELKKAMKKPPLYRRPQPPSPPPRPILPLPANLRMPPPGPDPLMGELPPPPPIRPLPLSEMPTPSRFKNRLPRLPKRKRDDEASGSVTKRKRGDGASGSGTKRRKHNDDRRR